MDVSLVKYLEEGVWGLYRGLHGCSAETPEVEAWLVDSLGHVLRTYLRTEHKVFSVSVEQVITEKGPEGV